MSTGRFVDNFLFLSTSLLNVTDNVSDGIHKRNVQNAIV